MGNCAPQLAVHVNGALNGMFVVKDVFTERNIIKAE
jgi:hypothetical protein